MQSFPARERFPFNAVLHDISEGQRSLWVSDDCVGFAITRPLSTLQRDTLLEYLAVDPARRSAGIGATLLGDVHAAVSGPLIFEVEDPADFPSVESERRISFYNRNGAAALLCKGYRAPNLAGKGAYPMLLFTLPEEYGAKLTGARLRELVLHIWVDGYSRDSGDPLLAQVLAGLKC